MFHTPAHKNTDHPAGQYREQHPSRQVDEDSRPYPATQREQHPRMALSSKRPQLVRKMDDWLATGVAEGFLPARSSDEVREAWQYLVDTGLAWRLQGWFGRTAESMIACGDIMPAPPKPPESLDPSGE